MLKIINIDINPNYRLWNGKEGEAIYTQHGDWRCYIRPWFKKDLSLKYRVSADFNNEVEEFDSLDAATEYVKNALTSQTLKLIKSLVPILED